MGRGKEQRIISLQPTGLGERRQFNQSRKCHKIKVGDEVSGLGGLDDNEKRGDSHPALSTMPRRST